MDFVEPIYYRAGFRYIPGHTRYAISKDGVVVDTLTNCILTDEKIDNYGYKTHYLYTPDRNCNRTVKTHRLLALAWLPNDDFVKRPFVNHIDGDKGNNALSNLEWCSSTENVNHALETGLNTSGSPMKVRDVKTGKVTVYRSINSMLMALGITAGSSFASITSKLPGYLLKKRYEIKLVGDDSPWYHESIDPSDFNHGKSYFTITVRDKLTGVERKFNRVKQFVETYGLTKQSVTLDQLILLFEERYPNCVVSYDRNALKGPYYVLDIQDRVLEVFTSIQAISERIGRTKAELQVDLSRGMKYIYAKRWVIHVGTERKDFSGYVDKPSQSKPVEVTRISTGEIQDVPSLKQAAKWSGLKETTVRKHLDSGKPVKGYIFRALDL